MSQARKHVRVEFDSEIELDLDGEKVPGRSKNISLGGIFVECQRTGDFGGKATLHVSLPGVPGECAIPCIIRWAKDGEGMGLQFQRVRAIETWAINKLMRTAPEVG